MESLTQKFIRKFHEVLTTGTVDAYRQPVRPACIRLSLLARFEEIIPFEDGNGRIDRLIMLKECLHLGVMPFIIDDKHRFRYLLGIKEWHDYRYEIVDVVMEAQNRFET